MPEVFRLLGWRFYFFSWEGKPREPVHIHISGKGGMAKIWVDPEVRLASSRNYSRQEQAMLMKIVTEHRDEIIEAWNEHFID
ncbi:DUF4160 domain-containing protein [Salmonella enterica]